MLLPMSAAKRCACTGFFRAGSIGLILFGGLHTLAVLRAWFLPPPDAATADLKSRMLAITLRMGPLEATGWGTVQILNAGYSILLFQAGVVSLLATRLTAGGQGLRGLAWANLVCCGLMFALSGWFQFLPPLVLSALIGGLFAASLVMGEGKTGGAAAVGASTGLD